MYKGISEIVILKRNENMTTYDSKYDKKIGKKSASENVEE